MKGYKTVLVNGAVALLPIVDLVANNGALVSAIVPAYGTAVISVLGLVNIVLRWITTTPIFQAEE